jgi:hypothetical protein
MRSYIRRACYIMLMILPILLIAQKMPSPGSEIGDAMFRPIWWTDKLPLHTAIYRNSESSNEVRAATNGIHLQILSIQIWSIQ